MASPLAELKPLYKKLLRLAKSLPDASKREATLQQIRSEFRSSGDLSDPTACVLILCAPALLGVPLTIGVALRSVAALVLRAQSKIGYLKIVTPRATSGAVQ
jgi:hypothetical protein